MTKKIPKEIEEFGKKAIPLLKEYGLLRDLSVLKIISFVFIGILVSAVFFYGFVTFKEKDLKSEFNNTIIPQTQNEFYNMNDFNSNTENTYKFYPNYTIINEINCPV